MILLIPASNRGTFVHKSVYCSCTSTSRCYPAAQPSSSKEPLGLMPLAMPPSATAMLVSLWAKSTVGADGTS